MIADYYKYLPTSPDDASWGLNVLNVGCTRIAPHSAYPHKSHPSHHNFSWNDGRVLQEFQVIYITRGEGIFESQNYKTTNISEGSLLLLFPAERHRYKPDDTTGWDEYWIGFTGTTMQDLFKNRIFFVDQPVISAGFDDILLNLFLDIIQTTREEKAGYQPLLSGMLLHLLGYIHSISRKDKFKGTQSELIVNKARMLMRSSFDQNISPEDIAKDLQISYSKFRKIFKEFTGMSPGQFQIQLKIHRAKELLVESTKSVKEIAYDLNFDSNFYFCRLFKEKTGMTPVEFRKSISTRFHQ